MVGFSAVATNIFSMYYLTYNTDLLQVIHYYNFSREISVSTRKSENSVLDENSYLKIVKVLRVRRENVWSNF